MVNKWKVIEQKTKEHNTNLKLKMSTIYDLKKIIIKIKMKKSLLITKQALCFGIKITKQDKTYNVQLCQDYH